MRTAGVKALVEEVLNTLPKPYSIDVIDEVFQAIEKRSEWMQRYTELCNNITKDVVNQSGGYWISEAVGRSSARQVTSQKSTLLSSYSKLQP
jgi:hypothetical protein